MMMEGSSKSKKDLKNEEDDSSQMSGVKKLKITRTFRDEQGREYTRTEIVRKQAIIDTYLKIRKTKDPAFIRFFATLDETQKEEMKKEKRRLQEQLQVAMTEELEEEIEGANLVNEELINMEGTKVKISKQSNRTFAKPKQSSNRRRTDPVVTLSSIFENILNEMRDMPDTQPFLFPVNSKTVPDYYKIVKKPMDLQTIRENLRNRKYTSRELFMVDIGQIIRNSEVYNGAKSVLTLTATKMVERCLQRLAEKEDKLMRLEKAINPLLDNNDLVALSLIFAAIINDRLKTVENSWPFHQPVNKKLVKDYYEIIQHPMDLSTLLRNVNYHKYHSRDMFIHDVGLIAQNSERYNGEDSPFSDTARRILTIAKEACQEQDEMMTQLEDAVKLAQELALDATDTDSVMTGTSFTGGQDGADLESVDHTIIHDETRDDSEARSFSESFTYTARAATSREEDDYVDVEGDDEV